MKTGAVISREVIILNGTEFARVFGRPPRSKDPKAPTMVVKNSKGQNEVVWAFASQERPHRTLTMVQETCEVREAEVMKDADHMVEDQAVKYHQSLFEKRTSDAKLQTLCTQSGLNSLSTLAEFQEKLASRYGKEAGMGEEVGEFAKEAAAAMGPIPVDDDDDDDDDQAGTEPQEQSAGQHNIAEQRAGSVFELPLKTPTPKSKLQRLES